MKRKNAESIAPVLSSSLIVVVAVAVAGSMPVIDHDYRRPLCCNVPRLYSPPPVPSPMSLPASRRPRRLWWGIQPNGNVIGRTRKSHLGDWTALPATLLVCEVGRWVVADLWVKNDSAYCKVPILAQLFTQPCGSEEEEESGKHQYCCCL